MNTPDEFEKLWREYCVEHFGMNDNYNKLIAFDFYAKGIEQCKRLTIEAFRELNKPPLCPPATHSPTKS